MHQSKEKEPARKRSWVTIMAARGTHAKFLKKSEQTRIPMTALLDIAGDLIASMKPTELADKIAGRKGGVR